ncbi:glycosyltransferase family 2 protein [Streptomyces californicus]
MTTSSRWDALSWPVSVPVPGPWRTPSPTVLYAPTWEGWDDGKHATKSGTYVLRFDSARALTKLIATHVPPGPERDVLMVRPFVVTLLPQFGPSMLRQSEEVRRRKMELGAPLMRDYWTPGLARRLKVQERLRLACVAEGRLDLLLDILQFMKDKKEPEAVRKGVRGHYHLTYPHLGEPGGLPDSAYQAVVPSGSRVGRRRGRSPSPPRCSCATP